MKRFSLCCLFLMLCITACKKKEKDIIGYHLKNQSDKSVHAVVYRSTEDYINQVNVIWQGDVQALSTETIPEATLTQDEKYCIDWYSYDLNFTNWIAGWFYIAGQRYNRSSVEYIPNTETTYFIGNEDPNYNSVYNYGFRSMFLKDSKPSTWKAIDAYDQNFNRIWDSLTPAQKNITFKMSFKEFELTNPAIQSTPILKDFTTSLGIYASNLRKIFSLSTANTFYLYNISKPQNVETLRYMGMMLPDSVTPSTDTIYVIDRISSYSSFLMVRQ